MLCSSLLCLLLLREQHRRYQPPALSKVFLPNFRLLGLMQKNPCAPSSSVGNLCMRSICICILANMQYLSIIADPRRYSQPQPSSPSRIHLAVHVLQITKVNLIWFHVVLRRNGVVQACAKITIPDDLISMWKAPRMSEFMAHHILSLSISGISKVVLVHHRYTGNDPPILEQQFVQSAR